MTSPGTMSPSAPCVPIHSTSPGCRVVYRLISWIQAGHDPRAERLERVAVLAAEHRAVAALPRALADVVADAVPEDMVECRVSRDVPRLLTDDDRELSLGLHRAGRVFRHDDLVFGPDERMHRAE